MSRLWKWERETPWPFVVAVASSFFVASVFIAMACSPVSPPADPTPWTPATASEPVPTEDFAP